MRNCQSLFFVICLSVSLFTHNALSAAEPLTGKVLRVYDGDTIKVEVVGKVRLIGIDAPEREASERDRYYLRKGISEPTLRLIAAASREYLSQNAIGRSVALVVDRDVRDKHGRLLAYVYLPDGRLLNRMLLEQGLATVYRRFDFSMKPDFISVEKTARNLSRGIWVDLKGRDE